MRRTYKNKLRAAIVQDEMNCSYFEGKDTDVDEVFAIANTLPFFAPRRCVIAENTKWLKGGNDKLYDFLDRLPESTILVLVEAEVDKRSKLYKKIKDLGYIAEFSRPDDKDMGEWAAGLLARANKRISRANVDLLLQYAGSNMENLRNELDKLIAYTGEAEVIERTDIDCIISIGTENRIFDMIRAIVRRQSARALALYEDLLLLREPPMRILALIAKQFYQLRQVKTMMTEGKKKAEIASALGVSEYAASQMMQQARDLDAGRLRYYVQNCVRLEEAVKSGKMQDRIAVEILIAGEWI